LGNSPISKNYIKKVDFLKTSGVVQGFWSLNPVPTNAEHVHETPKFGFQTVRNAEQLFENCKELFENELNYFSSMISKPKLGKIIEESSRESTDIAKAEKFLSLIQS
jgi:hypothetical protein